jgi:hypothetical protein
VLPNVSRFRVNVYRERGGCAMVMRVVQLKIRQFHELGLPDVLADFTRHKDGLVLVTGPTEAANRPRWPPCSTSSIRKRAATSSPLKTPSNTCTRTRSVWCRSEKSASTP